MTPPTTPKEAVEFILKIIDSCNTQFHFEAAGRLIELFREKYPKELALRGLLSDRLSDLIQEKFPIYKTTGEA